MQHPFGHEVLSQTHAPVVVLHSRPVPAGLPHAWQLAPPEPHVVFDSLDRPTHDVPLQQPAHAPPPQEHTPFVHACPLPHPGEQLAPAVPHDVVDCAEYGTHAPLAEQQPSGHDAALQTHVPAAPHVRPLLPTVQSLHAAPPVPQEVPVCAVYASHVPPVQHPLAQVSRSQAHVPFVVSHRPPAHAVLHALPPVPHNVPDWEAQGTQVFPLQHPFGQEPLLQVHVPLLTLHVCPVPHAPQVAPAVPHDGVDSDPHGSHVPVGPPLQQPMGQEVASQTQLPVPLHSCPDRHALHAAPPAPHDAVDSDA